MYWHVYFTVSQSVSQLKPTICLCVFLQTFFFPLNTETAKIIWSQAWKERIGINYPSLHIFEEHSSKFKAARFKFCLPPSAKFEPPEILRWAVTFTSVGGLWKYSTAFLNQMDFFSPSSELETLLLVVSCIQQTQSTRNCPFLWSLYHKATFSSKTKESRNELLIWSFILQIYATNLLLQMTVAQSRSLEAELFWHSYRLPWHPIHVTS